MGGWWSGLSVASGAALCASPCLRAAVAARETALHVREGEHLLGGQPGGGVLGEVHRSLIGIWRVTLDRSTLTSMKLPNVATIVASAVVTAVAVLNVTTFHFGPTWTVGVAAVLPALAVFGIAPISGQAFQAFLDLTPAESTLATALLGGAQLVVLEVSLAEGWRAALTGLIAVAGSLGFGPQVMAVVKQGRQARRERFAPARGPSV